MARWERRGAKVASRRLRWRDESRKDHRCWKRYRRTQHKPN